MKFRVHMLRSDNNEVREVDISDQEIIGLIIHSERSGLMPLLGLVYYYGQNENQAREHASVSIGDVIELPGGKTYLVDRYGFSLLSSEVLQRYRDTSRRERDLVEAWGERL